MILLLDVGNTRMKWAWLEGGTLSPSRAVRHHGAPNAWAEELEEWQADLATEGLSPERIVVSNVAGGTFARLLGGWSKARLGLWPEFVTSEARQCGITNGYSTPSMLGVDRWLGLVGARGHTPGPACIVNAGTAVTVDALAADGAHLGGFILPGMQLMQESLYGRTGNVAAAAESEPARVEGLYGVNTAGAIEGGILLSLATLAERVCEDLRVRGDGAPVLLLTGGDAPLLKACLRLPSVTVPDLVLEGLAAVAGSRAP